MSRLAEHLHQGCACCLRIGMLEIVHEKDVGDVVVPDVVHNVACEIPEINDMDVIEGIKVFLLPVWDAIVAEEELHKKWLSANNIWV